MKADKATMANSVEERLPLMDKGITEFAFSLRPELKLRDGVEKYVLRQAVKDLLPAEIVRRKKMGFSTPVSAWMKGEVGELAVQALEGSELLRGLVRKDRMQKIVEQLERKQLTRPRAVWTLYVLGLWHRRFFENSGPI
jgi:asparagine synthase (glutamine-hydrolysing)